MSSESTDSSYSKQHSKKHSKKDHKKKDPQYPHLAGEWRFVGQRVRYVVRPDGTIIPPDIYHPEPFTFDALVKQNGAFIEVDTPALAKPPQIGVISGKKGDWTLQIVDTNDSGIFTAQIKKACPKKFEIPYAEGGFACPPPNGDPLPCQLGQTPTVMSGQFIRKRDRWA